MLDSQFQLSPKHCWPKLSTISWWNLCDNIFKKGQKTAVKQLWKKLEKKWERTNPAHNKVSEKEGGGDAPHARAEIPLQSM